MRMGRGHGLQSNEAGPQVWLSLGNKEAETRTEQEDAHHRESLRPHELGAATMRVNSQRAQAIDGQTSR
jgi:hypothetical protein